MSKQPWIIGGALTMAVVVGVLGFSYYGKRQELGQASAELAQVRADLAKSQGEATDLTQKLAENKDRIRSLEQEKEAALQSQKTLEHEMRSALESKDVTISELQGKLTVNILDRILFDSGEADLKPGGADVLRKVAAILAAHPNLKVHVIGHTDNVPIRLAARKRFPSNWELSTARATAAVRFLSEQAGVDPRRLGAVGYGEFRPVAENNTAEGRARNRRIAITILSDEMVGADTSPPATASAPAPEPPPAPALPPGGVLVTNGPSPAEAAAAATSDVPPGAPVTDTNAPEAKQPSR